MITMIYACDENGAIGKDGTLPWRQPTDLQHFKRITLGSTIVMGRKTWDSLPGKLPNRRHIIMTRSSRDDVETSTYEDVIKSSETEEIYIIGGGEIYELFLNEVETIHRTIIHCTIDHPDTFAPPIEEQQFKIVESNFVSKSEKDQFDMTFQKLERI